MIVALATLAWLYVANIGIASWNLLRAWAGQYRPRGHTYFVSWWYCFDCLCNALAAGDPRETISSRAGKAAANGREWACLLCRFLGWISKNHCQNSIVPAEGGRAIIPDGE